MHEVSSLCYLGLFSGFLGVFGAAAKLLLMPPLVVLAPLLPVMVCLVGFFF
jgi:hypothetical protein